MILKVYSVHDRKAQIFNRPFFDSNEVFARRNFERALNDPDSMFASYPNDFELVCLGEFDDLTGKITMLDIPRLVDVKRGE